MELNRRGFTLVELLAMLVVLAILMAITVPNISGILGKSKTDIIKEDVTKMVDTAKIKIASDNSIINPAKNKCLVFTLEYLNDNDDYKEGPNGGKYDFFDSFVIVKRVGSKYKYYVRLKELNSSGNYGVNIADYDSFEKDWNNKIDSISNNASLKEAKTPAEVANNSIVKNYCNSADLIQGFYKETKGLNLGT